jgi:DNA polymerase I-like protein with 3'-5' exonuclease and polymerase domains
MLVPVYDIKNCGPRHRFVANGKLVHNSDSINLQNLPRKSPLKKAIQAPEGYLVIDCDSSQIEARVLAWMAQQEDLVAAFEKGEDVYKIMASSIYGKPVEEITDSERFVGKTTILGSGYGMGGMRFKAQLKTFNVDTPLDECNRIIAVYRSTYSRIPALWQEAQEALDAMTNNQTAPLGRDEVLSVEGENGIRLPNGLMLRYPGLRWVSTDGKTEMVYDTKRGKVIIPNRIYGGKCTENFTQALARIIVGQQMLKIAKRYRVVMTVHDSVVTLVPEAEADEARKYIEQCMRSRPKWAPTLPLNCESKVGASYGG